MKSNLFYLVLFLALNNWTACLADPTLIAPQIQDNLGQDSLSGRAEKAGAAQGVGNQGQGAAMANGIILMTTAMTMLASPIIPVKMAGAALMAKAGLEFAQAGADGNNASQNGAQKSLLTQNDSPSDASESASNSSPDLSQFEQFLKDQGAPDPLGLSSQLASGTLQPQSLLGALGVNAPLSPEDQAQADNLASQQLGNLFGQLPTPSPAVPQAITTDESATTTNASLASGAANAGQGAAGSGGGFGMANSDLTNSSGNFGGRAFQGNAFAALAARNSLARDDKSATVGAGMGEFLTHFAQAVGITKGSQSSEGEKSLAMSVLKKLGISTPKGKENIFQTAHRNYHAFGKWRKQTRVATLP